MTVYRDSEDVPAGTITSRLTPELQARADALVKELHAAGFNVVLNLDAPGEKVPTWLRGDRQRITSRLVQIVVDLQRMACECPECRKKRGEMRA